MNGWIQVTDNEAFTVCECCDHLILWRRHRILPDCGWTCWVAEA